TNLRCQQAHALVQHKGTIVEHRIRKAKPHHKLVLRTLLLTRKAIDGIQPRVEQICEVVPKAARFRLTASRTGDLIPTQGQVLSRNAGRGIDEDQPSSITDLVQLDHRAVRGWERQRGPRSAGKVLGASIVDRHREVVWQSIALHHGRDALLYSGYREASRSGGNKSRVQDLTSRTQLHDKDFESMDLGVLRRGRLRGVVTLAVTL